MMAAIPLINIVALVFFLRIIGRIERNQIEPLRLAIYACVLGFVFVLIPVVPLFGLILGIYALRRSTSTRARVLAIVAIAAGVLHVAFLATL